jgi:hypothetical protein
MNNSAESVYSLEQIWITDAIVDPIIKNVSLEILKIIADAFVEIIIIGTGPQKEGSISLLFKENLVIYDESFPQMIRSKIISKITQSDEVTITVSNTAIFLSKNRVFLTRRYS